MSSLISPVLIRSYFAGDCSAAEEVLVESWLHANPENIQMAMQWLESSPGQENSRVVEQVLSAENEVWNNTDSSIVCRELQENSRSFHLPIAIGKSPAKQLFKSPLAKFAAIVSGFILVSLASYLYKQNQQVLVSVVYGEVKQVTLPDHSTVFLNGNSTLIYKPYMYNNSREVWVAGEAFFNVKHQKNHQKFVVHFADKLEIEVLGTEFNLSNRSRISSVVLKTGKIKLNLDQNLKKTSVILRPGELVEVLEKNSLPHITKKEMVNTEQYYSWTYHKWILEATTLKEMLQKVEETYGINIVVDNKQLLQRKASGSIPLPSYKADLLLQDIGLLFELTVYKKGDFFYLVDK